MTHRIRRQILDLELPREAGAYALQRQAGRVFQEQVLPQLDAVFSQLAPADRLLRIERLEIDLGLINEHHWEQNFIKRCVETIRQQVVEAVQKAEHNEDSTIQILDPLANTLDVLQYFLETGTLPWYAKDLSLTALEKQVSEAVRARPLAVQTTLLYLLRSNSFALQRFIWQFSPVFIQNLLEQALGMTPGWIVQALQVFQSAPLKAGGKHSRVSLIKAILVCPDQALFRQLPDKHTVGRLFSDGQKRQIPWDAPINPVHTSAISAVKPADPPKRPEQHPEGIWVENAGLVLLGVYLPAFFAELQLTADNLFSTPEDQYRAAHLLHFLATGLENPEESAMVLPKLLCGLALEEPLPQVLDLSAREQSESMNLLKAMVRNWPALKNTSPDGLRSGFLQRPGLLSNTTTQPAWVLRPERLGQDVLLERLPWSISVIKLPWMEQMIQVEW